MREDGVGSSGELLWLRRLLGLYFVAVLAYVAAGFRPAAQEYFWQFLDFAMLRDNLLEGMLFLHAQPPLMNLVMGLVLKLAAVTGLSAPLLTQVPMQLCGVASVVGTYLLARRLGSSQRVAGALAGFLLLAPGFPLHLFVNFYTIPVQALIVGILVGAGRLLATGSPAAASWVGVLLLALSWTRSMYPALFVGLFWGGVLAAYRGVRREPLFPGWRWRTTVLALGLVAWPLKNWLVFGHFTTSSWDGWNLTRGLPETSEMRSLARGLGRMGDENREVPGLAEASRSFAAEWAGWDTRPVVAINKSGGPNWNHLIHLEYRRPLLDHAWRWRMENPAAVLRGALGNYDHWTRPTDTFGFVLLPGYEEEGKLARPWRRWVAFHDAVVYADVKPTLTAIASLLVTRESLAGRYDSGSHTLEWMLREKPALRLFALLWPLLVLWHLRALWRARGAWGVEEALLCLLLGVMLWANALPLLADGVEGSRMRFNTLPLQYLLVALMMQRAWRR